METKNIGSGGDLKFLCEQKLSSNEQKFFMQLIKKTNTKLKKTPTFR